MMGALVDYWYYTGDDQFVNLTSQGLLFQAGPNHDYMPKNQTLTEGNDDQGFWGLAVMSAAENNFPNPPEDEPQWLSLAQAVFNTQAARWDPDHCNGGLRWQIFSWNSGYDYKNSISQACFFALGARLALFTGNTSYSDWAEKTWDWMAGVEFIDENWYVYDGATIGKNCTDIVPYQFSYNAGGMILGAAAMYNLTEDKVWKDRLDNLIEGAKVFFTGPDKNIMTEVACEGVSRCNLDQQSFKAYLSRWLAATTKWAPDTHTVITPLLQASAVAAAKQCVGGKNGRMCGLQWNKDKYDGSTGVGQQMAAMEVTLACMVDARGAPLTADSGGTSKGDPGGGGDDIGRTTIPTPTYDTITAGDRAGAAILTALALGCLVSAVTWMMLDETSDKKPMDQLKGGIKGFQSTATAQIAAFAAGGGVMAVLGRKGDHVDYKEKGRAMQESDLSSHGSFENHGIKAPPPMATRDENPRHTRRLSNMPIGWPHNPSLRGSVLIEPSSRAQSVQDSPLDSAAGPWGEIRRPQSMRDSPAGSIMESINERPPLPQPLVKNSSGDSASDKSQESRPQSADSGMETASEGLGSRPQSMPSPPADPFLGTPTSSNGEFQPSESAQTTTQHDGTNDNGDSEEGALTKYIMSGRKQG